LIHPGKPLAFPLTPIGLRVEFLLKTDSGYPKDTGVNDCLRVEFLLKTDGGYPKDTGVNKPWQPLGIPFAITSIGQLHQSPPSPIPGDLGKCPSHQSHVLEHRDTYGQAQVCSKGHQGSSVDRPCQTSFHWIKFWHVRNPLPQSI